MLADCHCFKQEGWGGEIYVIEILTCHQNLITWKMAGGSSPDNNDDDDDVDGDDGDDDDVMMVLMMMMWKVVLVTI